MLLLALFFVVLPSCFLSALISLQLLFEFFNISPDGSGLLVSNKSLHFLTFFLIDVFLIFMLH